MASRKLRAALSAVMPRSQHGERNLILTVVGVTTLSTIAMVTYPLLVKSLGLGDATAGMFLGGTIHDVAQVVGAGYLVSPETGDVSTVVKLMRVAMLVPAVLAFSLLFRGSRGTGQAGRPPLLPLFLVAFVAIMLINSSGLIPASVAEAANGLSRWCLVTGLPPCFDRSGGVAREAWVLAHGHGQARSSDCPHAARRGDHARPAATALGGGREGAPRRGGEAARPARAVRGPPLWPVTEPAVPRGAAQGRGRARGRAGRRGRPRG